MSQIEITCIDQTAIFTDTPEIFSGDVNVDSVKFTFDNSWNDYTSKTAVFYNDPKKVYPQILNENNIASIPKEVIANKCKLSIGVVGTNEKGDIKTSKILTYNIGKGAISDDLESSTATPDIWLQILTQIEELRTFLDERQDSLDARITNLENQQIYVYTLNDTPGDEYESVSTLPYYFSNGGAVVLNNEIHILGGCDGSDISTLTNHYKWNGTSWVSVSTLPYNFYDGDAVVLNNEIHILGTTSSGDNTKHYKWNGTSWVSVSTLPYNFYDGDAVVLNNEIHILGGGNDTSKEHYKWNGTSWSSVSTLPYNFRNGDAVVLNNEIHILSGDGGLTKHYKWNGEMWWPASTLPCNAFYNGGTVVLNNEIYISGDNSYSYIQYKWNGVSWNPIIILPYKFYEGSAVVLNNEIHILGGYYDEDYTKHYKLVHFYYLSGYVKANVNIYLPISTEALTSNLEVIDGGYRVTEDGYVKILVR